MKYHLLKTQIYFFSHFLNLLKTLFIVLIEQSIFKTWIKSIENLKNKKVLFSSKWVTKTFYGG
ncbi:hypothetical protein HMPREF1425_00429 [Helicobacter pylori GAM71Ai]|nr:hypothetical protein HMPREF1400_00270 [Helicobacter pylori GAM119Bi]EMH22211.1 hypothetical protein HMPREF1417_00108 [Helicobacter pylori GAM260Bi]EMH36651.1 hypothetical protein HMPREF1425_00429 [Helicobacter pylori GAM71Ai]EMH71264.1 hypothetical protein HMPREF1452_00288 [Helicobacter pylori HP260Bi]